MLRSCPAHSVKFSSAKAELGRQWNTQNQSQPNPGAREDGTPCRLLNTHDIEVRACNLPLRNRAPMCDEREGMWSTSDRCEAAIDPNGPTAPAFVADDVEDI